MSYTSPVPSGLRNLAQVAHPPWAPTGEKCQQTNLGKHLLQPTVPLLGPPPFTRPKHGKATALTMERTNRSVQDVAELDEGSD